MSPNLDEKAEAVARAPHLLFVEDKTLNLMWVKEQLEQQGWTLDILETPQETLRYLEDRSQFGKPFPSVISIDLGLSTKPSEPDFGIALLEDIRKRWEGIPLVVHGSQVNVDSSVVKRILAQGASYFYLSNNVDIRAFVALIGYIAIGYVIYSPKPASQLTFAVTARPDPFAHFPGYWETLRLVNEGRSNNQIARALDLSAQGVAARIRRIAHILEALNEIELIDEEAVEPGTEWHRDRIKEWYRKNRLRYMPP